MVAQTKEAPSNIEIEADIETEEESEDVYIPNLNKLEVDVEVYSNKQTLGSVLDIDGSLAFSGSVKKDKISGLVYDGSNQYSFIAKRTITKKPVVRDKSKKMDIILDSIRTIKGDIDLSWLELDKAKMTGIFLNVPERDQMNLTVNEQLVVELYSK